VRYNFLPVAAGVHISGNREAYANFGDCQLLVASSTTPTRTSNVHNSLTAAVREINSGIGVHLLQDEWKKEVFSVV
jgi:hypothetical protein